MGKKIHRTAWRGRLQGISRFPIAGFYDGAETGFLHELGHQWINHMRVQPFASGSPHWPYSSMAAGIMGFSIGGRAGGQGGNFRCEITEGPAGFVLTRRTGAPGYNDLDLYLVGLLAANEVRDQFILADPSRVACNGGAVTGAVTRVGIADVVAALGPRTPTVTGGADAQFEIAVTSRRSSFEAPVTLSCDTPPANALCLFEQSSVTHGASGGTVRLTISTRGVARGTHVVIVTGRSGGEKHSTALSLTIQ